ncbi:MAG TPA: AAA family ATPase [Acidobacteriota bacterium]|nr:AAA family ATPase [Acidobacteriota bacterium]
MIVMIGGMPGSGKSTIGQDIACALGIEELIHTDTLKTLRKVAGVADVSVAPSHSAGRVLGVDDFAGYAVHSTAYGLLFNEIAQYSCDKKILIEGVQCSPALYDSLPGKKIGFYLTCPPVLRRERLQQKMYKRTGAKPLWLEHFDTICSLDRHLLQQTSQYGMIAVDNLCRCRSKGEMVEMIKDAYRQNS